jgi:hypothetical protein
MYLSICNDGYITENFYKNSYFYVYWPISLSQESTFDYNSTCLKEKERRISLNSKVWQDRTLSKISNYVLNIQVHRLQW